MQNLVPKTLKIIIHHPFTKDAVEFAEILLTLLDQFAVFIDSQKFFLLVHLCQVVDACLLVQSLL